MENTWTNTRTTDEQHKKTCETHRHDLRCNRQAAAAAVVFVDVTPSCRRRRVVGYVIVGDGRLVDDWRKRRKRRLSADPLSCRRFFQKFSVHRRDGTRKLRLVDAGAGRSCR